MAGESRPTTPSEKDRERMMENNADDLPFRIHSRSGPSWVIVAALVLMGLAIPIFYIALSLLSGLVTGWAGFAVAALMLAVAISIGVGAVYALFRSAQKTEDRMKIREVMTQNPVKCGSIDSVEECAKIMYRENVGYVCVQDEKDRFVGVVTDRDIVCAAIANGMDVTTTSIGNIMEPEFKSLGPDDSVERCLELMTTEAIRRVPILDNGEFVGVVSIDDLIAREIFEIKDVAPIFRRQLEEPSARHDLTRKKAA